MGVHGISAGGVSALSLAGAQWRMLDLIRHCQEQTEADFGFCFNGIVDLKAQAARRTRYDSARNVPEVFLPAELKTVHGGRTPASDGDEVRPDPRVAAITLSVPVAAIFSAPSLARIRIPVGVVTAERDTMLVPAFHSARVLRQCARCSLLAALPGAGHMDVLSPLGPDSVARAVAAQPPARRAARAGIQPGRARRGHRQDRRLLHAGVGTLRRSGALEAPARLCWLRSNSPAASPRRPRGSGG